MSKGYMVVYDYNGHELSLGNPTIFPVMELAEKYLRNYVSKPWCKRELRIVEREYTGHDLIECRIYNGKPVYNKSWNFGVDAMEIGDYFETEVINDYLDYLPLGCMRKDCLQLDEPITEVYDDKIGKWRTTYETWKYIGDDVWEYCGDCFRGENIKYNTEL